jgi:hypothetical protein
MRAAASEQRSGTVAPDATSDKASAKHAGQQTSRGRPIALQELETLTVSWNAALQGGNVACLMISGQTILDCYHAGYFAHAAQERGHLGSEDRPG